MGLSELVTHFSNDMPAAAAFLDIEEAFEWHSEPLHKLLHLEISTILSYGEGFPSTQPYFNTF
jgi:hypothetical protein